MQSESWNLSPLELGYVESVKALCSKCDAAAAPHQKRADSELAPAKSAVTDMLKLLAGARGVEPERVLSINWPDKSNPALSVALAPLPDPEPDPAKPEEGQA